MNDQAQATEPGYFHDPVANAVQNVEKADTLELLDSLTRKTRDILALADAISNPLEHGPDEVALPGWRHNTLYDLAELIADLSTMAHADAVEIGNRYSKDRLIEVQPKA